MIVRAALALMCSVLGFAGASCGGSGNPNTISGVSMDDAVGAARDAMNEEILDPASPAYDQTLIVGETAYDQLADGTDAWRVSFLTPDDEPSGLCIWVWSAGRELVTDYYDYELDRCPAPSNA